jgi:hypothetical protein
LIPRFSHFLCLVIPRKAAAVVEQNDIKGAARERAGVQQASQARPVRTDAADRFIAVAILFETTR